MKKRTLALLCAAAGLAGCASTDPGRAYGQVEDLVNTRSSPPLSTAAASDGDTAEKRTEVLLSSAPLTADAAVEVAFLNNPALGARLQEIGVAQAERVQAGLLDNPRAHLGLRLPQHGGDQTGYEFSVTENFLSLLTLPLRRRLAAAQYEQARFRLSQEIWAFSTRVRESFYSYQAARLRLGLRQGAYDGSAAAAELAERQRGAGNLSALDLARQKAALEEAGVALSRAQSEEDAARERLAAAMGIQDGRRWEAVEELSVPDDDDLAPAALEATALNQRWDLTAARREPEVLKRRLWVERLSLFGDVNAGLDAEKEVDGTRGAGPMVELGVPLFDRRQGSKAALRARMKQSLYSVASLESEVRLEVRLALRNMRQARVAYHRYHDGVIPQRETVLEQALKRYNFMLSGVYDLLTAKREELEAREGAVESLQDYWISHAELERALGGPLAGPAKTGHMNGGHKG